MTGPSMPPEGLSGDLEAQELDLDEAFAHMGRLIGELDAEADPELRGKVFELLDWIDGFHREAVTRIVGLLPFDAFQALREDPVIDRLIETYSEDEEEPEDLAESLEEALDEIRPYLHSHGGEMEVLDVTGGVVRLRLMGSCDGCPSSTITLTQGVEKILKERWPGFRKIEVEGLEEEKKETPQKLLQIQTLRKE
ncbi:MAG TPA: NifU family protein [Actinomycetota bacterium]|nr:NifU family protein [Actinomycetota bacterium]